MPRERVQHGKSHPVYDASEDGSSASVYTEVTPSLDIEWARDPQGRVQVAIEFSRQQWIDITADLQQNSEIAFRAIYTENLDRQQINHMIKTLRRARDAAFGADE